MGKFDKWVDRLANRRAPKPPVKKSKAAKDADS